MPKLYTVSISYDFVVVADDEDHAHDLGEEYMKEALSDMSQMDVDLTVAPGVHACKWDDECIPYGGDGNTRTGEYKKGEK